MLIVIRFLLLLSGFMISMFGVEVSMNMMYICWLLLFLLVIGFLRVKELIFIVGYKVLLGIVNI